jgi:cell division protein FtsL
VLAVMLVAIVGLRVAVLKLGSSVGSQIQQATMLESSNTTLRARISALSDNGRIEKMAEAYGMHMPNPLDEHFVAAGATSHLRSALGNISAPASSTFLTGLASEQQSDLTATQQGSSLSAVGASTGTATTSGAAGTAASTATASPSTVNASTGTTVGGSLPSSPTSTATSSSTTGSSSGSGMSTATTGTGSSTGLAGSSTGTGSSTGLAGSSTSASVTGSPGASLNNGYTNTDASASGAGAGSVASTGGAGLAG